MKGKLTTPEARSILFADEVLDASFAQREAAGLLLGLEEGDAWRDLVAAAHACLVESEALPPSFEVVPYPGGNEPDFQTLFMEAMATGKAAKPSKKGVP